MSYTYDPEVPPGYQDADIEMAEAAEAADSGDIDYGPFDECTYCRRSKVGEVEYFNGHRTVTLRHCIEHEAFALSERKALGR